MTGLVRDFGRRVRARPVVAGVCAVFLLGAAVVIALIWPRGPALREVASGGSFGASLPSTRAGKPLTFGSIPVCVSERGVVWIDAIRVIAPQNGLTVTDFGVRPLGQHDLYGAERVALDRSGFGGTKRVTSTCGGDSVGAELAVEFTKPAAASARGNGLLVWWHSAHRHGTLTIPFHMVLCEGPDQDVPECQAFPHSD